MSSTLTPISFAVQAIDFWGLAYHLAEILSSESTASFILGFPKLSCFLFTIVDFVAYIPLSISTSILILTWTLRRHRPSLYNELDHDWLIWLFQLSLPSVSLLSAFSELVSCGQLCKAKMLQKMYTRLLGHMSETKTLKMELDVDCWIPFAETGFILVVFLTLACMIYTFCSIIKRKCQLNSVSPMAEVVNYKAEQLEMKKNLDKDEPQANNQRKAEDSRQMVETEELILARDEITAIESNEQDENTLPVTNRNERSRGVIIMVQEAITTTKTNQQAESYPKSIPELTKATDNISMASPEPSCSPSIEADEVSNFIHFKLFILFSDLSIVPLLSINRLVGWLVHWSAIISQKGEK